MQLSAQPKHLPKLKQVLVLRRSQHTCACCYMQVFSNGIPAIGPQSVAVIVHRFLYIRFRNAPCSHQNVWHSRSLARTYHDCLALLLERLKGILWEVAVQQHGATDVLISAAPYQMYLPRLLEVSQDELVHSIEDHVVQDDQGALCQKRLNCLEVLLQL